MKRHEWPPAIGTRLREAPYTDTEAGTLAHVIAHVVTDDDGTRVVIRHWSAEKQRWRYEVLGPTHALIDMWTIEKKEK